MNALLVFVLTLGDSMFGCLQVFNLTHHRRAGAFFVSLGISACKLAALVLVLKKTTPEAIAAYVLGGAIGAQISMYFNPRKP